MKKLLSVFLAAIMTVSCAVYAVAQDEETISGNLNVISFNVDGLPVPSFLSSTKRNPLKATKLIAEQVNASGCDILCAQEDFNFHNTLKYNLDMDYATISSGMAAIGDGLNIFSKYPIYNVGRVAWDSAYGVYDCGSDELTPKGILYCTVEIADGVFVDVYTLHADAWEDDASMIAKAEQFDQLIELIEEHSGTDRAVILTGDFNTNYSVFREGYIRGQYKTDLYSKLMENFIGHGFKDAWIEKNTDGVYDFSYSSMYNKYNCDYPRVWDTLDHVYYRDGAGVSLELEEAFYDDFNCDGITWDGYLSDHSAVRTSFKYTVDMNSVKPVEELKTQEFSLYDFALSVVKKLVHALELCIINLPSLFENGIGWIK
ncbi:MAG: endonuclease/exonuclease/phosphatase family protein [Ruminococcus sp.]|nr:endonuclease/exonuclease/phosphatase family protein [Candidatus Copronaster equi]